MQQNDLTALSKWLESASLEQSIYDGPEADNLRAAARCVAAMAKHEVNGLGTVRGTDVRKWTVEAPDEGEYTLLEAIEAAQVPNG